MSTVDLEQPGVRAESAAMSGVDGLQALRERLDRAIMRMAALVLSLPVLAALTQLLMIAWHPDISPADRHNRAYACLAVIGVAALSWALARYRSAASGALFMCSSAMAVVIVSSWNMGWGMSSTSLAAFPALIAIGGFLVGPHVARWLTLAAVSYLLALWGGSLLGVTGHLAQIDNVRMASYGGIHITVCFTVGWLVSRYGGLFMQMIRAWLAPAHLDEPRRSRCGHLVGHEDGRDDAGGCAQRGLLWT
ncbi:MAG: hypothetical protein C4K60_20930 [Ideonella sp. MAG2]|nr:MAG: hypothetical protein C4K60_20930 [Ideonella sp. MAG2]